MPQFGLSVTPDVFICSIRQHDDYAEIKGLLCWLKELLFLSISSLCFQRSQVHTLMQMKLCGVSDIEMMGKSYRTAFIEKIDGSSQIVR